MNLSAWLEKALRQTARDIEEAERAVLREQSRLQSLKSTQEKLLALSGMTDELKEKVVDLESVSKELGFRWSGKEPQSGTKSMRAVFREVLGVDLPSDHSSSAGSAHRERRPEPTDYREWDFD
jgi:hypothetical protein